MRERHAAYYTALVGDAEPWLWRSEQLTWLPRLDAEQPNIRAALAWNLKGAHNPRRGAGMAINLAWFWWLRNQWQEGLDWLIRALPHRAGLPAREQARLLALLSLLAVGTSDYQRGAAWASEAQAIAEAAGDTKLLAFAGGMHAAHAAYQGDIATARELFLAALRQALDKGDSWLIVAVYWNLGTADLDAAQQLVSIDAIVATAERLGERWNIAGLRVFQGWCHYRAREFAAAIAALEAATAAAQAIGDRRMLALALRSLGRCRTAQGAYCEALGDFASAMAHFRAVGDQFLSLVVIYDRGQTQLRQGDRPGARDCFRDLLAQFRAVGQASGIVLCLVGLAETHASAEHAAQVLSALTPAGGPRSILPDIFTQRDYDEAVAQVRARLHPEAFEAAWRAGQQLAVEETVALASA